MANRSSAECGAADEAARATATNPGPPPRQQQRRSRWEQEEGSKLIDPSLFVNADVQAGRADRGTTAKNTFADFDSTSAFSATSSSRVTITPTQIQDVDDQVDAGRPRPAWSGQHRYRQDRGLRAADHPALLRTDGKNDVLIITPTRELAAQIEDEFRAFTKGMKLYAALCVGGTNINPQIKQLEPEPHVVIGTPGRLRTCSSRASSTSISPTRWCSTRPTACSTWASSRTSRILDAVPRERQTLCFSATITPDIER